VRGWLAAVLSTLDDRELGAIQLFDEHDGDFTVEDGAPLVHLAQMTSAAVARDPHYHPPAERCRSSVNLLRADPALGAVTGERAAAQRFALSVPSRFAPSAPGG
jgi:hypothetical protein